MNIEKHIFRLKMEFKIRNSNNWIGEYLYIMKVLNASL